MDSRKQNGSKIGQLKELQYPAMIAIFSIIALAVFFAATRFLSTNIDTAINPPDESIVQQQLPHIDTTTYEKTAKKLNLPSLNAPTPPQTEAASVPTSTQEQIVTSTEKGRARNTFSIAILNSTKKIGIAKTLKEDLELVGFKKIQTSNTSPSRAETTVSFKESMQADQSILDEIVSITGKRFIVGDPQILEEGSPYDIVITLGNK